MKLEKAIETLHLRVNQLIEPDHSDLYPSMKLGIEAMKKIQEQRNPDGWLGTLQLPGETEEDTP